MSFILYMPFSNQRSTKIYKTIFIACKQIKVVHMLIAFVLKD